MATLTLLHRLDHEKRALAARNHSYEEFHTLYLVKYRIYLFVKKIHLNKLTSSLHKKPLLMYTKASGTEGQSLSKVSITGGVPIFKYIILRTVAENTPEIACMVPSNLILIEYHFEFSLFPNRLRRR